MLNLLLFTECDSVCVIQTTFQNLWRIPFTMLQTTACGTSNLKIKCETEKKDNSSNILHSLLFYFLKGKEELHYILTNLSSHILLAHCTDMTYGNTPGLMESILLWRYRWSCQLQLLKASIPVHMWGSPPLRLHTHVSGWTPQSHQEQEVGHTLVQETEMCGLTAIMNK